MSNRSVRFYRVLIIVAVVCLSAIGISGRVSKRERPKVNSSQSGQEKSAADLVRERTELARTLNIDDIRVVNETHGFKVSKRVLSPDGIIRFTLKNGYPKAITAYRADLGENGGETFDTILCTYDCSIAPGGTTDTVLVVSRGITAKPVVINAVLFEDGTADGDPDAILLLRESRLGESMQMETIRSLLGEVAGASSGDLPTALDSVESKLKEAVLKFREAKSYPGGYRPEWVGSAPASQSLSFRIRSVR